MAGDEVGGDEEGVVMEVAGEDAGAFDTLSEVCKVVADVVVEVRWGPLGCRPALMLLTVLC